jgi:hypothetical protein
MIEYEVRKISQYLTTNMGKEGLRINPDLLDRGVVTNDANAIILTRSSGFISILDSHNLKSLSIFVYCEATKKVSRSKHLDLNISQRIGDA